MLWVSYNFTEEKNQGQGRD